jgi:hypothetical protein
MKKIKSILIILVTILSISCNNSQSSKNSSVKAFEEFQINVKTKDFLKAKRLLSSNENGVYEKYIDTIFNVLDKPTIEFIPEEKDGAYGVKKIGDADLFYAYLKEDNKIFSTIGIMICKNTNGYQIINITKVATSKEKNVKKEPIQSEVKTENNKELATQKSVETAGAWRIKEECLAAINESKFSELNKVCNRHDQNALMSMINAGYVKVLNTTDKIEMVDYGFAKSKIKLKNEQEYFVANEFITH